MSGAPIVPVAFSASRKKVLGSWDGFIVPAPFARGVFVYGQPIEVGKQTDESGMESARRSVESALADATVRAEAVALGSARVTAGERLV